jgi:hypothetical protein
MIITPNHVYYFTFKNVFNQLNGIYKVESLLSYSEVLAANINLANVTYKANGATDLDFNNDLDTIRAGKIAKLVLVNDTSTIIYIPEHLFDKIPDGSVQKYYQLGLAVDLGIFSDIDQLSVLKSEIEQIVEAMIGVKNKAVIYTVKNSWMTVDDYKIIDDTRKALVTTVSNHFTDKLALTKQVDSLKTLVKYYEDLLKSIQG